MAKRKKTKGTETGKAKERENQCDSVTRGSAGHSGVPGAKAIGSKPKSSSTLPSPTRGAAAGINCKYSKAQHTHCAFINST